ncbi:MAG: HAD hydrolase-like protein [Cyclobacteriaceae bacterium]
MSIQLVVCDLAGTTVKDNKDVHRVLQMALREYDVHVTINDANEVMGLPKPLAIRLLLEKRKERAVKVTGELIDNIHRLFVTEMMHFYCHDDSFGEKEGVSETFRRLKENGIKVAVDTGFDREITNAILKRVEWVEQQLIDASVTSDEVPNGRPHPDLVFKAMQLTNVSDAKSVAKVGDTISDLIEGNSAGCGMVVGVTSGAFTKERLEQEKHTHLIENIPQLLNILQSTQVLV